MFRFFGRAATGVLVLVSVFSVSQAQAGLRDGAAARGLYIGAAAQAGLMAPGQDQSYSQVLAREYNLLTPENEMKFFAIEPVQNSFNFTVADAMVAFAQEHQMKVRGHTLIWSNQLPSWLSSPSNFSGAELLGIMQNHITTVMRHYAANFPGAVIYWDVVNESVSSGSGTIWNKIGGNYVYEAFKAARAADPSAKLCYNDWGGEGLGSKSDQIYSLVSGLKAQGLIDCVGLQMHIDASGNPSFSDVLTNMKRLAALGVEVHVTEMDVKLPNNPTPSMLQSQAVEYQGMLTACLYVPACKVFTTWGFTDKYSWIPQFTNGKAGSALPFDVNYNAKPAYNALAQLLAPPSPPTPPQIQTHIFRDPPAAPPQNVQVQTKAP